jgi:predicted SnoaL-like aldol condensation-catalyzing enzyme/predicted XRE-type DNA-binding protein
LPFDNPEEELLKAKLAREIRAIIKRRRLSQESAAKLLGMKQTDISSIVNGQTGKFSIDRLVRCLDRLDYKVDLVVRHKARRGRRPSRQGGLGGTLMQNLDRNKRNVVAFYDLMFNQCRPREAIELYAGDRYTQHNPGVADAKEGFIAYFEEAARDYPGKRVEFMRVIAEGDLVVLHCRQDWPGDHVWAGIDIFRLDAAGRIVEHWDVLQIVPDKAKNPNGMF